MVTDASGDNEPSFGAELKQVLRAKRWWVLGPVLVVLGILLLLFIFGQLNASPFVYQNF
jgi:hypothetical protein